MTEISYYDAPDHAVPLQRSRQTRLVATWILANAFESSSYVDVKMKPIHPFPVSSTSSPSSKLYDLQTMADIQEEAIRAVSAVVSSCGDELLSTIDSEQKNWQQQLDAAKSTARTMLTDVLSQQNQLRSSLSTSAQLWEILRPSDISEESTPAPTTTLSDTSSNNHFLATRDQMVMVKALQNVSHTIYLVEFILAAPQALQKAHNSLTKIQNDGLLEVQPDNAALLVDSHAVLAAVERLRDVIRLDAPNELLASTSPSKCFAKATETRRLLEQIVIKGVFANILPVSQTNPRLLVSAARVIEAEEKEDAWWRAYLHRCTNADRGLEVRPYVTLSYKQRARSAIIESLQKVFVDKEKELELIDNSPSLSISNNRRNSIQFRIEDQQQSFLRINVSEVLDWIEDRRLEIETVRRFVTPCVPPSFAFAGLYEKELHGQFMRLVTRLLHLIHADGSMVLSESDLIELTTWYGKYQKLMGEQDESIDTFLTEADRKRLIAALQKHCRDSINEQVRIALATDKKDTASYQVDLIEDDSRHSNPSPEKQGLHRTDLPDVVLGFVMEQVKRLISLKVQGLDIAIATTVAESMQTFQTKVRTALTEQRAKSTTEEFGLYICATANNMARCLEYSEDLRELFVSLAFNENRSGIEERLESVIEGFRNSASMSLSALINGMTENLSMHANRFFAPNTGTEVMLDVVATLEDYFSEYEMYLLPYHFEHLAIESLKRIVIWYLAPFLKLSDQHPEEGVARRFASLPTFDEAAAPHEEAIFDEHDEHDIISRRSEKDHNEERRMSKGLGTLNGEAVVAQIDKDIGNLTRFMRRKVILYQKKQLEPTLEPMLAIRSLYECASTAIGLSNAFRTAQAVVARSTRPAWVAECGVRGQLTPRVAEVIWESRKDVNPVVLLEAITMIRTAGDTRHGLSTDLKGRASDNRTWASRSIENSNEFAGGRTDGGGDWGADSLLWAPSPSKLRWVAK